MIRFGILHFRDKTPYDNIFVIDQLCPTSGSWGACGPVEGLVMPNLGFRCSKSILHMTTCTYFNNLEFDIFDAGVPQCHLSHLSGTELRGGHVPSNFWTRET